MKTIDSFSGRYRFLSNFWSCCVVLDGSSYRSVEHAFQAAKSLDPGERKRIRNAHDATSAKRMGRNVELREDWEEIKLDVMHDLLRKKFASEPLRSQLLKTGNAKLVEGNWWHDQYWGVCEGKGMNHLGRLLMVVRDEIRNAEARTRAEGEALRKAERLEDARLAELGLGGDDHE